MKSLEYNTLVEYSADIINKIKELEEKIQDYNDRYQAITCSHEKWNYCYQITKKGTTYYRIQCSICGKSLGNKAWIKKEEIPEEIFAEVVEYNPNKSTKWQQQQQDRREKRIKEYDLLYQQKTELQSKLWWISYEDYLCSEEWEKKRQMRLHMNKQILMGYCECCGEKQAIMCHHIHYKNLRTELMTDLAAVCSTCHRKIHAHLKGEGNINVINTNRQSMSRPYQPHV